MGRLYQRLSELEQKQEAAQMKLSKLDTHMETMGESVDRKHLTRERKVILRDLTDLNIRIRNLQRFKKKEIYDEEFKDAATKAADMSEVAPYDIDSKDENFDPEAIQFVHIRPEWRVYPKIPLPHARVGRGETGSSWGSVEEGQFAGVEEEEIKLCDKLNCHDGSDMIGIFGQEPATGYAGTEAVRSVKNKAVSVVPVTTVSPSASSSPADCICRQPLHLLSCSSAYCAHSFYDRVMTPCPNHPSDHYMLDPPTICPICKAVPLVEDSSLLPSVPDLIFTKIKSKPVLGRKVFAKSVKDEEVRSDMETRRVNRLGSADQVLMAEKPGKMVEKPPSTIPGLQKKLEEAADKDDKMCAAKTEDGAVHVGGVGGDLLALRERLRRRLVVARNARRASGQDAVK